VGVWYNGLIVVNRDGDWSHAHSVPVVRGIVVVPKSSVKGHGRKINIERGRFQGSCSDGLIIDVKEPPPNTQVMSARPNISNSRACILLFCSCH
jgi:hypothetical protein